MGIAFAAALLAAGGVVAKDQTVKVMVLGTFHMANPGRDIHNTDVEDVTTQVKQRELEDVAQRLGVFNPTKIALEGDAKTDDFISASYHLFKPEDLTSNRNEIVQVGYRIAHENHLENVYLIDESSDVIDYFPYQAVVDYAEEYGETAVIEALNAAVEKSIDIFEAAQKKSTIAELLARMNDPATIVDEHERYYYSLLQLADRQAQPGAELNAYWYMRNAKIFSKLIKIAKPGDRIIVVFGAGHAYWLRHFVENTPGFELIEPNDYLR